MAAMNAKLNCMQFLIDNLKIDVDLASETGKVHFSTRIEEHCNTFVMCDP